jgi:hypothetical protein
MTSSYALNSDKKLRKLQSFLVFTSYDERRRIPPEIFDLLLKDIISR